MERFEIAKRSLSHIQTPSFHEKEKLLGRECLDARLHSDITLFFVLMIIFQWEDLFNSFKLRLQVQWEATKHHAAKNYTFIQSQSYY